MKIYHFYFDKKWSAHNKYSLNVAERVGGFFANAAGLNSSRYDYVTSTMTEEQWDIAKQNAAEERAKRQAHLEQKTVGGV